MLQLELVVMALASLNLVSALVGQATDASSSKLPIAADGVLLVELTEPMPGKAALADPVVAGDWPEERRKRAGKILVGGAPVEFETLRTQLRGRLAGSQDGSMPGDIETGLVLRLTVAPNRSWSDARALLELCGDPGIAIRSVELSPPAAAVRPKTQVCIVLTDSLPGKAALADPVVAAEWPKARQERAGRLFADGQQLAVTELRSFLKKGLADSSTTSVRIEAPPTRPWRDVLEVVDACTDSAVGIRFVELVPTTWTQTLAATTLATRGGTIRLREGKFGVTWEFADNELKISEVGEGASRDAGIQVGDRFVTVDGRRIGSAEEMTAIRDSIWNGSKSRIVLGVLRGTRRLTYVVTK